MLAPERPPVFRFDRRAVRDHERSESENRYISKDQDYIIVVQPGSKDEHEDTVENYLEKINVAARRGHPYWSKYASAVAGVYEQWKRGEEIPVNGTPIKGWHLLSPAEQDRVVRANIFTVEDLATASEEGLTTIGMGARSLKERAVSWLKTAANTASVAGENAKLQAQVEQLSETVRLLEEKLAAFGEDSTPRKRGRKAA